MCRYCRDGVPVVLLYATRNTTRPFGAGVVEIATIFASYVGAALDNAGLYQELRRRATRDPLTGLANRELAVQRLDRELAHGSPPFTGVLFCDLDGFKAVNDRLGHDAGDELLQQVAARLKKAVRPTTSSRASAATNSSSCSATSVVSMMSPRWDGA